MSNAKTKPARPCLKRTLLLLLLSALISTTACSRYVVVPGGETIQVNVQQWDQMRQDNELLIQELPKCKNR